MARSAKSEVLANRNVVERKLATLWLTGRSNKRGATNPLLFGEALAGGLVGDAFVGGLRIGLKIMMGQIEGIAAMNCPKCLGVKVAEVVGAVGRGAKKKVQGRCGSCGTDAWL